MSLEYTLDFNDDYKNSILKFLYDNKVDCTEINQEELNELSLAFHTYQSENNKENFDEETSTNPSYSSNMMIKWLSYLENEVRLSVESIIDAAKKENIKISKFPLHFELQLDIQNKSYQVVETNNDFNINI